MGAVALRPNIPPTAKSPLTTVANGGGKHPADLFVVPDRRGRKIVLTQCLFQFVGFLGKLRCVFVCGTETIEARMIPSTRSGDSPARGSATTNA